MSQLSKKAKARLDEAVMLSAMRLHDDPRTLTNLHFSRPDRFAVSVSKFILNHWDARILLNVAEDLTGRSFDARVKLVAASIRRLYRRGELRRAKLKVPVLLGRTDNQHLEDRMMTCYWPATVLDQLARC